VKRIIIVPGYGYSEELIGPLETFDQAGYEVDFMTPTGKRPVAITVSMDPEYVDPPLGRSVTTAEVAEKVKAIDTSSRLDKPLNLSEIARPYLATSSARWRPLQDGGQRGESLRRQVRCAPHRRRLRAVVDP
jgi:hypothetical protein